MDSYQCFIYGHINYFNGIAIHFHMIMLLHILLTSNTPGGIHSVFKSGRLVIILRCLVEISIKYNQYNHLTRGVGSASLPKTIDQITFMPKRCFCPFNVQVDPTPPKLIKHEPYRHPIGHPVGHPVGHRHQALPNGPPAPGAAMTGASSWVLLNSLRCGVCVVESMRSFRRGEAEGEAGLTSEWKDGR